MPSKEDKNSNMDVNSPCYLTYTTYFLGVTMRKVLVIAVVVLMALLVACSNKEPTPNERFSSYLNHWNDQDFDKMHQMLSKTSRKTFKKEVFVDRFKKIYKDIKVSDLKIDFKKLSKKSVKKAMDDGKAVLPFTVSMKTIAGPISFDYEASLVQEGTDDDKNWYIDWDPGFIFPQMKDGGELRIKTTPPIRGEIRDRNEMPLAMNDIIYEVGIIPEKLGKNPEQSKQRMAELLGLSVATIDEKLNEGWVKPNLFVPIAKITKTDETLWNQLVTIEGVTRQETSGRIYPGGAATSTLVGYIGPVTSEDIKEKKGSYDSSDMIGKRGLEELFEEQLRGEKGVKILVVKEGDETLLAEKEGKNGENIKLTIDINIQEKIYDILNGDMASVSVIHAKTGETLGLVSSPSFNPNEILYGTRPNIWKQLEDDPKNPLLNRFYSTYAPGSVLKPITAAIGMKNGSIDPKEGLNIKGLKWSNGKGWGDYKVTRVSESNGPVDLHDAIVRSDNIYFAMQAVKMGSEAFEKGLKQFGLGEDFPYEYPITTSSISSTGKLEDEVLLANTSYGQGELEMSSLHLAIAYSTFLNEGNMLKPTLLANEKKGQIWKENLLSADQAEVIKDALRDVVVSGTAKTAGKQAKFPVSGKTGTAELKVSSDDNGQENGWFVGYPTENEDIIVSLMIEKTKGKGSYSTEKAIEILNKLKE